MDQQRRVSHRALLLFCLFLTAACTPLGQGRGFDQGHEWIVPRPAAQIHLRVTDIAGTPIPYPVLWLYRGNEKYTSDGGFVGYDPLSGVTGNKNGGIIASYLGEGGGGYEVPMNAPSPPAHRLVIEAPGYAPASVDLDTLLFTQTNRTGKTDFSADGRTIQMIVVFQQVRLEAE